MTNPALLTDALAALTSILVASAAWGGAFIAAVWALCRLAPRLPAGIKATLWSLACVRLLIGLVWITPVPLPVLPASDAPLPALATRLAERTDTAAPTDLVGRIQSWPSAPSREFWRQTDDAGRAAATTRRGAPRGHEPSRTGTASLAGAAAWLGALPWRPVLGAIWVLVVVGSSTRPLRSFRQQRRVVARARKLHPRELPDLVRMAPVTPTRHRLPDIRSSSEITSPQLVWVGRPVVLVPDSLVARGGDPVAWAICHELVHLRRRDHWLGLVVHAAERLFFFHPLAHLAAREFAICREIACDAEVVRAMSAPPRDYGRLLVTLGVRGGRSRLAVAGAASSFHALKRRLVMLQHVPASPASRWWRLVAIVAIAGVVPIQLVARRSPASAATESGMLMPVADRRPTGNGTSTVIEQGVRDGVTGGIAGGIRGGVQEGVPPPPPPAPAPPAPPAPPPLPPDGHGFAFVSSENGESWAYVSGNSSVIVGGSSAQSSRIDALRRSGTPFFWFERGDREYVIRDAATLRQIEMLLEPVRDLGKREGQLGAKRGELGAKQSAVGARQAALAAEQAARAAEVAKRARDVEAEARALADLESRAHAGERSGQQGSSETTARAKAELEARLRELEARQEQLERDLEGDLESQMEQLERDMKPLEDQQEELAKLQEELGREQEALARLQTEASKRSRQQLRALMDEAIKKGTATTVR